MIYSYTQIASISAALAAIAIVIWMAGAKRKLARPWPSAAALKKHLRLTFAVRIAVRRFSRSGAPIGMLRLSTKREKPGIGWCIRESILLQRFVQDDRVHISQPERESSNQGDAGPPERQRVCRLSRRHRRTRWHSLPDRLEDDSQSLSRRARQGCCRSTHS